MCVLLCLNRQCVSCQPPLISTFSACQTKLIHHLPMPRSPQLSQNKEASVASSTVCFYFLVQETNKASAKSVSCILHQDKTTQQSLQRALTISYQKRLFTGSSHNSSYLINKRQILKDHECKWILISVSEGKWIFIWVAVTWLQNDLDTFFHGQS